MKHIVKRAGHTEKYDQRKLYASIYSACLVVNTSAQEAELVAAKVTEEVEKCLENKHELTSGDIFRRTYQHFKEYDSDAAYLYKYSHSLGR